MDVVHNDKMKFVLMAFDKGTGLSAHRAPGNAIITVLEGKAIIGYEGKDHPLSAGESLSLIHISVRHLRAGRLDHHQDLQQQPDGYDRGNLAL